MKVQEKKQASGKKNDALEPQGAELSDESRDNAKRDANEPLYLLRYE